MHRTVLALAALALSVPAHAEVAAKSDAGFVSRNTAEVAAAPDAVWKVLVDPAQWWNSEHTWSGDAKNLTLETEAGGCFCETLPVAKSDPLWSKPGSVMHMTVVNIEPGRALRMSGGLGPLQSEAVNAVLTITLKPTEKGTRLLFEYVVGGYMRYPVDQIAPLVDGVMAEQLGRLAMKLDPGATGSGKLAGPPAPGGAKPTPKAEPKPEAAPAPEPKPVAAPEPAPAPAPAPAAEPKPVAAAPKPAPVPAAPAPSGYVTRTFTVTRTKAGFVLTGADDTAYLARFAGKAGADSFAAGFARAAGTGGADTAKTVTCTCTGSFADAGGQAAFTVIDAGLAAN